MKILCLAGFLAAATALFAQSTSVRTPCQAGMKFTAGVPIRIIADGYDPNGWQYLDQESEASEVRFSVDGVQAGSDDHTRGNNDFEIILTGLSIGIHSITTQSTNYGGAIANSSVRTLEIVPLPAKANTVTLAADVLLSGSQNLNWQDAVVNGNGHRVTSAAGWTGSIIIRNCLVYGLGVSGAVVPTLSNSPAGIQTVTNGGSVSIESSVFEWTGALFLTANGTGTISIRNNEFRASMYIAFVSSDPDRSPYMDLRGNCTGRKVYQGNNAASGFLRVYGMTGWLIGGNTDAEVNVFLGQRGGTYLENCTGDTLRGNFMHHDYIGQWSQGHCMNFGNVSNILAEHNVIRASSWPVQSFSGEFRYNFIEHCGHEMVRTLGNNTLFHHNILSEPGRGGDAAADIWLYNNTTGVQFYNNTFNTGIPSPAISLSNGSTAASVRNNIFYGQSNPTGTGIVDRYVYGGETDANPRVLYADYNCFYNPASGGPNNYGAGLVTGITEGQPGFCGHDLGGVNGQVNPQFTGAGALGFNTNEVNVWNRTLALSAVLADYRARYTPVAGSPVIDAGDPADGAGVDIGAVGAASGAQHSNDLFGKFGSGGSATEHGALANVKMELTANPNPFRTGVRFQISDVRKDLNAKLTIFDVHGKLVQILTSDAHGLTSTYSWNAAGFPAGLYLARLTVGKNSITRPILLVK